MSTQPLQFAPLTFSAVCFLLGAGMMRAAIARTLKQGPMLAGQIGALVGLVVWASVAPGRIRRAVCP